MAKKKADKSPAKPDINALRYGKMTIDELEQELQLIQGIVDRLQGTCAGARAAGITTLEIDGFTKLSRGVELLAAFASNVNRSYLKAK